MVYETRMKNRIFHVKSRSTLVICQKYAILRLQIMIYQKKTDGEEIVVSDY